MALTSRRQFFRGIDKGNTKEPAETDPSSSDICKPTIIRWI